MFGKIQRRLQKRKLCSSETLFVCFLAMREIASIFDSLIVDQPLTENCTNGIPATPTNKIIYM